jgi:hypothetical protein
MSKQPDQIQEAIESYWGKRCPEHEDGCPVCEVWKQYDQLTNQVALGLHEQQHAQAKEKFPHLFKE